ncbi:MAG: radical SAM protein [Candidatus Hydrogenedentes bacterium]|nr:radical SAM protein [Candidatus Hydrogenedentota bacterium]
MADSAPAYLSLLSSGELARRADEARRRLDPCVLCAHECRAARRHGATGRCSTGERARTCGGTAHFGEEAPLVGAHGSGTIFFSGCNLDCQFCQNYEISAQNAGQEADAQELARMMLALQAMGCHNINLVSPSHVVPQILEALLEAAGAGLHLPLVYNTGGYDSLDTLRLLDGLVDIYMPDMKYADAAVGERFSLAPRYPEVNRAAVKEMHRQVGDLVVDGHGVARRGLLVRHLVLPEGLAGTAEAARFLADEISVDTYVNVMDQYRPCYRAHTMPPLNRRITPAEYAEALRLARDAGLHRLDDRLRPRQRP